MARIKTSLNCLGLNTRKLIEDDKNYSLLGQGGLNHEDNS